MQNRNVWAQLVLHMAACVIRFGILEGGLAKQGHEGPYAVLRKELCLYLLIYWFLRSALCACIRQEREVANSAGGLGAFT